MKKLSRLLFSLKASARIKTILLGLFLLMLFFNNAESQVIQIGTATTLSTASNGSNNTQAQSPFNLSWTNTRRQYIYKASELIAAGAPGASIISTVAFFVGAPCLASGACQPLQNWTVSMALASQTDETGGYYTGATTTVYGPATVCLTSAQANSWITFTLSTPFSWDGTSSLVVQVCNSGSNGPAICTTITSYGNTQYTATTTNSTGLVGSQTNSPCPNGNDGGTICGTSFAAAGVQRPNIQLTVASSTPCAGAPSSFSVSPSSQSICAGSAGVIALTGINAGGLTYNWQSSATSGGPYTNVTGGSGATTSAYTTPTSLPSNPVYYVCQVTCSNSGLTTQSAQATASVTPFVNCYCVYGSFTNTSASTDIANVNLQGGTILLNNTTTNTSVHYNVYTTPVPDLSLSTQYTVKVTVGSSTRRHNVNVWIDWDQNGVFGNNANEFIGGYIGPTSAGGSIQVLMPFTVPAGATVGNTAMRVDYDNSSTTTGFAGNSTNPTTNAGVPGTNSACTFTATAGETQDYRVQVVAAACSGTPTAGTATAAATSVCPNASTTVNLTGFTTGVSNITFQWQVSVNGGAYANVAGGSGATTTSYVTPVLANGGLTDVTYAYQCIVTCTVSGLSATSSSSTVTVHPTPVISITPPSTSMCNGSSSGTFTASNAASGSTSYAWAPAATLSGSNVATVFSNATTTTTYTVTGSANSCQGTATIVVSVNPTAVTFSPSSPSATIGSGVSVTASAGSSNGTVTYSWAPSNGLSATSGATVTASPLTTTTYTVTATDPGSCSATGTVTVNINSGTPAQVACGYTWSKSNGSNFALLSSPTILASGISSATDDAIYPNQSIGFNFDFNGITYTSLGVSTNGFVWFGSTNPAVTEYNPISTATALEGVISVFGANLKGAVTTASCHGFTSASVGDGTTSLSIKTSGTSPNRTFTIQWHSFKYATSSSSCSLGDYQVILNETTNTISFMYNNNAYFIDDAFTGQVGIRGASNSDFNNRSVTCVSGVDWDDSTNPIHPGNSVAGTANTSICTIDGASCDIYPLQTLVWTWTPALATPTISPSAEQDVCPGTNVGFTSSTTISSPIYQWLLNGSPISGATNSAYTATPPSSGNYFYSLQVNSGACYRISYVTPVITTGCGFSYSVKCFLQGYYIGSNTMSPLLHLLNPINHPGNDVDTVTIEVHRATAPYDSLYSFTGVLGNGGNITGTLPGGAAGNFYIVVKHRNSIDTWSGSAVAIAPNGMYDFTTGAAQAHGGNESNLGGGVYGIYSGDVVKDDAQSINSADKTQMQSVLSTFSIGVYNVNDITGDGFVDEDDYRILLNNIALGISVSHP